MQMIREALGTRRFPVFFVAILAVLLFAAPPQASAENIELTAFTATPGNGKVTLKWTVSNAITGSEINYWYVQRNTVDGTELGGKCSASECDATGLFNGDKYQFRGVACQDRIRDDDEVEVCSNEITVYATPTAE